MVFDIVSVAWGRFVYFSVNVCLWVYLYLCVCVCVREREKVWTRVCVCVSLCECVSTWIPESLEGLNSPGKDPKLGCTLEEKKKRKTSWPILCFGRWIYLVKHIEKSGEKYLLRSNKNIFKQIGADLVILIGNLWLRNGHSFIL